MAGTGTIQAPGRGEGWLVTAIVLVALAWSGLAPHDRLTWVLEVVWVVIGLPLVGRSIGSDGIVAISILLVVHLPIVLLAGGPGQGAQWRRGVFVGLGGGLGHVRYCECPGGSAWACARAMLPQQRMRRFSLYLNAPSMTIHTILKMGDPRLLRVAQPVTEFDTDALHLLVRDMFETMQSVNGAGLAAPQIGVDLQLVIFGSGERNPRYPDRPVVPPTVLLNPVITPLGDEEDEDWEGCLSVPGLRGKVPRWSRIRYTGFDPYGDPIDRTVEGFHARVVQHECDHLIGKLYPMRVRDFTQFGFTEVLFPEISANEDD